ncbi:MAG: menaquinone biosynthesis protein [Bacillota bacterium]|nr:menaquinone biosynthesis protein [Bacillota bacterium]
MRRLRLGQVDYLNCLPVYHALEEGLVSLDAELVKGTPAQLNHLFLEGKLDLTPLSSIEYARHSEQCLILPGISISADGRVASILLFSKVPVPLLKGRRVCLPTSSATSIALLQILLQHYYRIEVEYLLVPPNLESMLGQAEAALLIGDDALLAHQEVLKNGASLYVTDLGEVWKDLTGQKMVYALWVLRREFAEAFPEEVAHIASALLEAKRLGYADLSALVEKGRRLRGLPVDVLEDYFATIRHDFGPEYRQALLTYYDYARRSGLLQKRVRLQVWGEGQ